MTKFYFKFKKPYFWPFLAHFPNFGGKKVFHKIELLCTTSLGFLVLWQNSEKFNDPISRKHPDVRRQRWTDPIS